MPCAGFRRYGFAVAVAAMPTRRARSPRKRIRISDRYAAAPAAVKRGRRRGARVASEPLEVPLGVRADAALALRRILLDDHLVGANLVERLALPHDGAALDEHRRHGAGERGRHLVEHLHHLDDVEWVALLEVSADGRE